MSDTGIHREGPTGDGSPPIDRPIGRRRSDHIVGTARATLDAIEQASSCARSDRPVWIAGPDGSGRQHLARAIHAWSPRAAGPLLVVSCRNGSERALAREIFGAPGGDGPAGALSRASGGTLLLEGVDCAPATVREALARAVAAGRFHREGDGNPIAVRARLIATSLEALETSPFGNAAHHAIRLAPLAERREDVLGLAAHFLRLYADEAGVAPVGFTAEARNALLSEPWEGNVRELAERVRQAVKLAGSGAITAEALLLAADGQEIPSFKEAKRAFETRYVMGLLRRCHGNISHAARLAKKDRKDFYDVIRRTGVDPAKFR